MNPVRNIKLTCKEKISNGVKITIKNLQNKIPINPSKAKKIVLKALGQKKLKYCGEITVCFVSDKKIRQLNYSYCGFDTATDVLAFDLSVPGKKRKICADLVISVQTAAANSKIFNTTVSFELDLYLVHGILHLLGYKDNTAILREAMQRKALRILGERQNVDT